MESEGGAVKIAEPPAEMIPKGLATAGTLAYVATAKYADGTPLYRLSKILDRYGIRIPRSTMASWMVMVSDRCRLIMEFFQGMLKSGILINADETPVQVLNEPGRANTANSCMWVFRGGDPEKPVVLFHYAPTRSGGVPKETLAGYQGYLQTDAYSACEQFEKKGSPIILVGCMAHVRRNLVKVIDARGKGAKKNGSAEVALEYIRKFYLIEKIAREQDLSPEEILALRKDKAEPILKEFKVWMDKRYLETPPKGLLGKALSYARNDKRKLTICDNRILTTPEPCVVMIRGDHPALCCGGGLMEWRPFKREFVFPGLLACISIGDEREVRSFAPYSCLMPTARPAGLICIAS
ncbi:IS66 family transposase [Desulfoferrobacter suflitae]|uniref:IS66 family transposase n=1 Tax=Desulfoferrobacter suflitae TaxID=2865782 RepID=UPI002164E39C|nr:IS66 family transposase [Desulfoferrobacter suflitae]MCK8601964.1 IS66 family transposase [Desulfoferrobacter suflitae]